MTRRYQSYLQHISPKLGPQRQQLATSQAQTTAITRSEYTCRAICCVQYLVIVATCVSRHTQVEPQVHRAQIENSNVTPAQAIRATRAKAIIQNTNSERSLKAQQQTSRSQARKPTEQYLRTKHVGMQGTLMRKATAGIRLESQRLHRMARSHSQQYLRHF